MSDPPGVCPEECCDQEAHQAHLHQENGILEEFSLGTNSVRDERDKPFGVSAGQEVQSTTSSPLPPTKDKGPGLYVSQENSLQVWSLL